MTSITLQASRMRREGHRPGHRAKKRTARIVARRRRPGSTAADAHARKSTWARPARERSTRPALESDSTLPFPPQRSPTGEVRILASCDPLSSGFRHQSRGTRSGQHGPRHAPPRTGRCHRRQQTGTALVRSRRIRWRAHAAASALNKAGKSGGVHADQRKRTAHTKPTVLKPVWHSPSRGVDYCKVKRRAQV